MSATHRSSVFEDPLRETRLAVLGGRFQQGWNALRTLPAEVRGSPDGLLLGAMATWRLGEFERSRTAAIQARDGFRGRGDTDGEMRAENVAAAGAFALGDLTEAERGFNRALSLADDLADDLMIARCANNLGNVAYYLARTETALSFYRLAIANFEKLAFWSGLAEGWLNTAIVLHDAEDFAASREAGERAIAAAERSGDGRILGQALAARSETDIALGDLALAKVLAERALTLAQTHDHVVGEADARRVLAVLARHRGEPTARRSRSPGGSTTRGAKRRSWRRSAPFTQRSAAPATRSPPMTPLPTRSARWGLTPGHRRCGTAAPRCRASLREQPRLPERGERHPVMGGRTLRREGLEMPGGRVPLVLLPPEWRIATSQPCHELVPHALGEHRGRGHGLTQGVPVHNRLVRASEFRERGPVDQQVIRVGGEVRHGSAHRPCGGSSDVHAIDFAYRGGANPEC